MARAGWGEVVTEALFELDDREGSADIRHVLMPNMAYACGGSILTKRGHFTVGITTWDAVTCEECRAHGEDSLRAEMRAMQGRQAGVA